MVQSRIPPIRRDTDQHEPPSFLSSPVRPHHMSSSGFLHMS